MIFFHRFLYAGDHGIDLDLPELLSFKKGFKNNKMIEVCEKHNHPSYKKNDTTGCDTKGYDIAILKFCIPIKLSNEIHPIAFKPPNCNKNVQSKEKGHDKIYMAGRMDGSISIRSTLTNVVDLSLMEFGCSISGRTHYWIQPKPSNSVENAYENQTIRANNNVLIQKGDSGYPLWRIDQECNQLYQVSDSVTHTLSQT